MSQSNLHKKKKKADERIDKLIKDKLAELKCESRDSTSIASKDLD